jgi:2-polyprenyl-3-methyl-5-hydroxy-6-metoxy-1,4-benzoquinol methylase
MMGLPGLLSNRQREEEIMDQPGLDPAQHQQALRGLARINAWSGSARILWPAIAALARHIRPAPLRVLDVASGGGDVPIRLWRRARRSGLRLDVAGCDKSAVAVAHAQRQADAAGADVQFFTHDAMAQPLPAGYGVLTCSLFMHHLASSEAICLLEAMKQGAGQLVLINDLRRSALGWLCAYVVTRILSRSSVVHVDGPRSVAAAYTCSEAAELAQRAGLTGAAVARRWPFRFLITWHAQHS